MRFCDADMKEERNWLLQYAVPQLQQFAVDNELQLQIVDLRWGASRDMATDPDSQPVYIEQINYCRQYSAGPFFAVRLIYLLHCYGRRCRGNVPLERNPNTTKADFDLM